MFSEWTPSRAAGKRLEDVIRKQWAVPSTHNPLTWSMVVAMGGPSVFVNVLSLIPSVALHSQNGKIQCLYLIFDNFS